MTFTVLRLLDKGMVECVVFFPSQKRKSKHRLEEYGPYIQELLKGSFALATNGYLVREPLTKEQYEEIMRNGSSTT